MGPSKQPTMREVARLAGVGIGTVSRVVNGGGGVSPRTTAKVRDAIAQLGFRRNEIAHALRPGKHATTIALLLGDLTNPFYSAIAKSAIDVASRAGYAVVVGSVDENPDAERRAIRELVSRRIAGLMMVPDAADHAFLESELASGTPVVFLDRPAGGVPADSVVLDNEGGGRSATEHLLAHGHRRIAALVAPSYYTTGRRLRGYRKSMRQAGVAVDERLVMTLKEGSPQEAERAVDRLMGLAQPPTAIFATTNFLSEGVVRALRRHDVPPALVGFDDFPMADLLETPVTVVTGDPGEMGRVGGEKLLERVNGGAGAPKRIVLPVRLIPRGSGERPPA